MANTRIIEVRVYSVQEAAEILRITDKTIYNYIKQGKIKAVRIGRWFRIPVEEVERILQYGTEG